jgi:hypothetical protein
MIKVRQHWLALMHPWVFIFLAAGLVMIWAAASPAFSEFMWSVTQVLPDGLQVLLIKAWPYRFVLPFLSFALAGGVLLIYWSVWQFTYFQVDEGSVTYSIGPFYQNTIPRGAIQDIRKMATPFGYMFGYGTVVLDAGRQEEVLTFVPRVDEFVAALQRY